MAVSATSFLPVWEQALVLTGQMLEAARSSDWDGLERLERVVAAAGPGAVATGRGILDDVERHAAGQVRSDDICLVCLGRAGGPAAHPSQRPASARRGGRIQPRR